MSIECLAQLYHQSSTPSRLRVQTFPVNAEEFHSSSVGFLLSACYTNSSVLFNGVAALDYNFVWWPKERADKLSGKLGRRTHICNNVY